MSDCCASRPSGLARDAADAGSDSTLPSVTLRPGVTLPDWSAVSSPRTKEVLLALVQSDHVQHRWSGYSADADRVRSALLRIYAEVGRAPSLDALAARSEMDKSAVSSLLDTLSKHDLVLLDGERIVGAYPFTDGDSGHRVKLDGRSVNAMCAVDALGIGAMLDCDVAIESRCRHCGSPIRITTRTQGRALAAVGPQTAVVWLSGRYEGGVPPARCVPKRRGLPTITFLRAGVNRGIFRTVNLSHASGPLQKRACASVRHRSRRDPPCQ